MLRTHNIWCQSFSDYYAQILCNLLISRSGTTKRGREKLFSPGYPQILWKMVSKIGADFAKGKRLKFG